MTNPSDPRAFIFERTKMVESQLRARGLRDERVLAAMARVPRHLFVGEGERQQAYEDHPLPIGKGQTISQPYIVGAMLDALAIAPHDVILEIGTGSGYVTALLCELGSRVYSIERHRELSEKARAVLAQLGCNDATLIVGDGSCGYSEAAPYDAILVSAATPMMPPDLFAQLREGGRMILPVGPPAAQELQLINKQGGDAVVRVLDACRFVPLVAEGCHPEVE